jgi:hypothetical protein
MNFVTVVTSAGLAKMALATANNTALTFSAIAIGDGNGAAISPSTAFSALVREVWRGTLTSITRSPTNNQQVVAQTVIPLNAGPFTIREIGLFLADGTLFAIASYPESFKAVPASGGYSDVIIQVIVAMSSASVVNCTIDVDSYVTVSRVRHPFMAVKSVSLQAPPPMPQVGDVYLVPAGATGAWFGYAGRTADWEGNIWSFGSPDLTTIIGAADNGLYWQKKSGGWVQIDLDGSGFKNSDFKNSVRAAAATNITPSGLIVVDGYQTVAGDRILLHLQSVAPTNGVYVASAGVWTRAVDALDGALTSGATLYVERGAKFQKSFFTLTTLDPITVGTTGQTWTKTSGASIDDILPSRLSQNGELVVDWNVATDNGWYRSDLPSVVNSPNNAVRWLGLVEAFDVDGLWVTQTLHGYETDSSTAAASYRRSRNNGVWTAWYLFALTASEIQTAIALFASNADNLASGTVADARLPARIGRIGQTTTNWNTIDAAGFYSSVSGAVTGSPADASNWSGFHIPWAASLDYASQIVIAVDGFASSVTTSSYRRDKVAGVWGAWFQWGLSRDEILALVTLPSRLLPTSALITNWNSATENGWYYAAAGAVNEPLTAPLNFGNAAAHYGMVFGSWPFFGSQILHAWDGEPTAATPLTWRRDFTNGVWGAWYRIYSSHLEINGLISMFSAWTVTQARAMINTVIADSSRPLGALPVLADALHVHLIKEYKISFTNSVGSTRTLTATTPWSSAVTWSTLFPAPTPGPSNPIGSEWGLIYDTTLNGMRAFKSLDQYIASGGGDGHWNGGS